MVDFCWGAESAHEDSIGLVVLVSTDPPALLTSGADRCVKAWRLDGRPQGLLLQGLAPHAPNPRWSFRCLALEFVKLDCHLDGSGCATLLVTVRGPLLILLGERLVLYFPCLLRINAPAAARGPP